ncbi:MAG: hypothetical protein M3536_00315 [Actinomycetota bacterium]|nr:hypothetical protein [Actinomycetota bacterium]
MPDCEAEERNLRAVYEIEQMTGSWIVDLAKLKNILTGRDTEPCTHKTAA